jgi:hypothetical protein
MYPYYEELAKVLHIPTSGDQWPVYIQRNLIIAGDTCLVMLLLIMEGGVPTFFFKQFFL